jgi:hypothetical protein
MAEESSDTDPDAQCGPGGKELDDAGIKFKAPPGWTTRASPEAEKYTPDIRCGTSGGREQDEDTTEAKTIRATSGLAIL